MDQEMDGNIILGFSINEVAALVSHFDRHREVAHPALLTFGRLYP